MIANFHKFITDCYIVLYIELNSVWFVNESYYLEPD